MNSKKQIRSEEERNTRRQIVKRIVLASRSIRNLPPLTEIALNDAVDAWEASFAGIPTRCLHSVYQAGIRHKCYTAEQFQNVWEMQVEAEARRMEHEATIKSRHEPEMEPVIPSFIAESWSGVVQRQAR